MRIDSVLRQIAAKAHGHKVLSLLKWLVRMRKNYVNERIFIILLAIFIGFLSGITAVVIKNTTYGIQKLFTSSFLGDYHIYFYVIYPAIGIFLTIWVVKKYIGFSITPGIPNALYGISKNRSIIRLHNLYSHIIGATLTVGFGGSAGLESPTVGTTSAIGSRLGKFFGLNYKTRTLLIGCAASGALASIFKAPIAALVFAVEVIMLDLTTASMIPLLLASVSAAITSNLIFGDATIFNLEVTEQYRYRDIPYFVLLGVFCGGLSILFSKIFFSFSKRFDKVDTVWRKAAIGGLVIGVMLFLFPVIYGEGYNVVNMLMKGNAQDLLTGTLFENIEGTWVLFLFLAGALICKMLATVLTLKIGGVGGVFAPTLFMGATAGWLFVSFFDQLNLGDPSAGNYILVAMAGMMAGVLHSPLTAIFLIAEITGGYDLFIPLIIVASISYLTVKYALPHSIYTLQLAERGALITHDKDRAVLTLMDLRKQIETNFVSVDPYDTLGELVNAVAHSSRNLFPVIDLEGNFMGIVELNEIREIMFDRDQYEKLYVHNLMHDAPEFIYMNDNMDAVMQKFETSGAWNLPVIDDKKYVGFVSKSKLFSGYREMLKEFTVSG